MKTARHSFPGSARAIRDQESRATNFSMAVQKSVERV